MANKISPCSRRHKIRENLHTKQKGRCYWCNGAAPLKRATIDHIIPRSRGGSNLQTNLVMACRKCNAARADRIEPPGMARVGA